MKTLQDLQNDVHIAQAIFAKAISERWPVGSSVRFVWRHSQKTASIGTVAWISGNDVGVKYEKKDRYRGMVTRNKRVHWTRILA